MATKTIVEVLDISLNVITQVKAFVPFDTSKHILQYSKELSYYGRCKFKVSTKDVIFTTYGDIFVPHKNHIRIRKGTKVVWQGAIVDNPRRNKDYVEITAFEYEFYLSKNLIKRTSADYNGTENIFRIFKSGTMADAVTALITETAADYASSTHILKTLSVGTIENPDYPAGFVSGFDKSVLTGGWTFGESSTTAKGPTLQFDYIDALYVLRAFGMYTFADFEIDSDLKFNFKKFLGNKKQKEIIFTYGNQGNIVDYNAPRLGQRMMNQVVAIATDSNGVIIHEDISITESIASIKEYGVLEGVAAYSDIMDVNLLRARAQAELPYVCTPDETNITIYLNENSYPLGTYDVGDLVTIRIKDTCIDINEVRRIVGYTILEGQTGSEIIALQTNKPLDWQLS